MSYISMPIWLFVLLAFWIIAYTVVTIYLVRKQENDREYLKKRIEDSIRDEYVDVIGINKVLSRLDENVQKINAQIDCIGERIDCIKHHDLPWIDDTCKQIDNRIDSLDAGLNLLMNDLVERGVVEINYVDLDNAPESEIDAKILPFHDQSPINMFEGSVSNEHFESGSEGSSKPCTDENS